LKRALPWLLAFALLLAIATLQLSRLHHVLGGAHPTGDHAIFELNVRQALSGAQRVGPYSQGFYHPGTAYFYWLALPYALLGHTTFALHAGAALLTLLFFAGIWAIAARFTSGALALILLVPLLGLELAYLGDFPEFDYWPPYVLFFGFALFVLLAALLLAGERRALTPLVALGSFLVQTHVSYAPAVAIVGLFAAVTRRELFRGRGRRELGLSLLALSLLWALPAYAELFGGQGNLARLRHAFFGGAPPAWQLGRIADTVALEFSGPLQFALFRDRFIVPDAPKHYAAARVLALLQLFLLALAFRRSRARGDAFSAALCGVSAGSLLIAAWSLTRIKGAIAPHHTAWISTLGFTSLFAIACGLPVVTPRWLPLRPLLRFSVLAGAWLAFCLVWPARILAAVHANPEVGELTRHAAMLIRESSGRPRITWSPTPRRGEAPPDALIWATSVMLELERQGLDFFTGKNPDLRWMLGKPRWEGKGPAGTVLVFFVEAPPRPLERVRCVERGDNYFMRYPACVGVVPP